MINVTKTKKVNNRAVITSSNNDCIHKHYFKIYSDYIMQVKTKFFDNYTKETTIYQIDRMYGKSIVRELARLI